MEITWPSPLYFDPTTERSPQRALTTAANAAPTPNRRLLCAACKHVVTDENQRIAVRGRHEHTFINPHGVTYHIGCFREAAGCATVGEATTEFTWFPAYIWRVALCANCQTHLGWRFQSLQDDFHGLVVNRLVLESRADSEPADGI